MNFFRINNKIILPDIFFIFYFIYTPLRKGGGGDSISKPEIKLKH